MRIGRLGIYTFNTKMNWSYETYICGCKALELGYISFCWQDKNCKCCICDEYDCICLPEVDDND